MQVAQVGDRTPERNADKDDTGHVFSTNSQKMRQSNKSAHAVSDHIDPVAGGASQLANDIDELPQGFVVIAAPVIRELMPGASPLPPRVSQPGAVDWLADQTGN